MADLSVMAQAETYAAALQRVTGTPVTVRHREKYSEVFFTDPRAAQVWLETQLRPGKPGKVRIDFGPVLYPVAIRKTLPVALGLFAAGAILGRMLK